MLRRLASSAGSVIPSRLSRRRTWSSTSSAPSLQLNTPLGELAEKGYLVLDDVFPISFASKCRSEIQQLHRRGRLYPNSTHFVTQSGTKLLEKSGIFETELMFKEISEESPALSQLFEDRTLVSALNQQIPQLNLRFQTMMVQFNAGEGACFPLHFDSDPSVDTRLVTALLYLNELWRPEDGGEMRLYPVPHAPVDIAPIFNRLVLFSSQSMLHRVLPSHSERYCLTLWMYVNTDSGIQHDRRVHIPSMAPGEEREERLNDVLDFLLQPNLKRHFMRVALAEEWAKSLAESHEGAQDLKLALDNFWREVEAITRLLNSLLRRTGCSMTVSEVVQQLPLPRDGYSGSSGWSPRSYF